MLMHCIHTDTELDMYVQAMRQKEKQSPKKKFATPASDKKRKSDGFRTPATTKKQPELVRTQREQLEVQSR